MLSKIDFYYVLAFVLLGISAYQLCILFKALLENKKNYDALRESGVMHFGKAELEGLLLKSDTSRSTSETIKDILIKHQRIVRSCWIISTAVLVVVVMKDFF